MTDEKYLFTQEVRQKKNIARSARNMRTHNGKGGAVKFPSDFMTRKELNAMNGEVQSYRLNEPMTWKEFNKMPDDIKTVYIKALRQKFNVSCYALSDMFGVTRCTVSRVLSSLSLNFPTGKHKWDEDGFAKWRNGVPAEVVEEMQVEEVPVVHVEETPETEEAPADPVEKVVPRGGSLSFEGKADAALNTVVALLGGANVRISIVWELREDG